jgi:uncharacterized phage protein (TIGR01671 family)
MSGNSFILPIKEAYSPLLQDDLIHVYPDTMEQFTGLLDKNGKEIYEGDICKMKYPWDWIGEIIFEYGSFSLNSNKETLLVYSYQWHCDDKEIEVIGNIHQNPELLEESK